MFAANYTPPMVSSASRLMMGAMLMLLLQLKPAASYAEETVDATALINRMSQALEQQNYVGTFIHVYEGHIESMRILHSHDGVGVNERMISLNGEAREVYRNRTQVTCIWPGSQSVIVSKSKPRDLLPTIDKSLTSSELYSIDLTGEDRVAGLPAYVVSVVPKDQYRYGYRFWIEKETSMLLRSQLLDAVQNRLEEVMFTDISFPEYIPEDQLQANTEDKQGTYSWIENTRSEPRTMSGKERVGFTQLPNGYRKTSETYRPMPMNDHPVSHVLITDGMASVSVYVEYTNSAPLETGHTSMGAVNAYGRTIENAIITVVGEVPKDTVRLIGDAVSLQAVE